MTTNLKTKKPIDSLTIEDLEQFPIWEFIYDDEDEDTDETYVRPINSKTIPLNGYSMSVYTVFKTNSGLEINGIIEISTDDGIDIGHAALFYKNQYIFVPSNSFENNDEEYNDIAKKLGLTFNEVFPLNYTICIPIEGHSETISDIFQ